MWRDSRSSLRSLGLNPTTAVGPSEFLDDVGLQCVVLVGFDGSFRRYQGREYRMRISSGSVPYSAERILRTTQVN